MKYDRLLLFVSVIILALVSQFCIDRTYSPEWNWAFCYVLVLLFILPVFYKKAIYSIDDGFPFTIFLSAFILKLAGSAIHYWTVADLYQGTADAMLYQRMGKIVATVIRETGTFPDFAAMHISMPSGIGTRGMIYIVGVFYAILPESLPGIFVIFSAIAFAGSVLFYRTYRIVFPDSRPFFYRFIVFFLPSILFWPSSLGKDSVIFFGLGCFAYGLALATHIKIFKGLRWIAIGMSLPLIVRPPIAVFMILAAVCMYFFSFKSKTRAKGLEWIVLGACLIAVMLFAFKKTSSFFNSVGITEISTDNIVDYAEHLRSYTAGGGSRVELPPLFNVRGIAYGVTTVLFRPFLWEAHNFQAGIAGAEALLFINYLLY